MAKHQLFEAAAEILAASKSSASGMPLQKVDGTVVEIGGPTPTNGKPDDDSEKIDATKNATSATAPTNKPSDASADTQLELGGGKKTMKEDVDAMFADDETISEEFKSKVSTIFEARVLDKIAQITEEQETRYAGMLEEAVEAVKTDLTEKVNDYLSYVVEQWIADNEIAIESGLRAELTEEFIAGLKNLFAEHYIDVPAEKVDLVEELATKVETLEGQLNEEIQRGIETKKALVESRKVEVTHAVCEGLTDTQVEKIKSLAESVEFATEADYKEKLETIRENYFPSGAKKASEEQLHEQVEDGSEKVVASADPFVQSVMQAISKTKL